MWVFTHSHAGDFLPVSFLHSLQLQEYDICCDQDTSLLSSVKELRTLQDSIPIHADANDIVGTQLSLGF